MASQVKSIRASNRTQTSLELEISLENSETVTLDLNSISGAAIVKAIVEHGPYAPEPYVLDFASFGFASSPSAEGHVALAFKLSKNLYPVAIRVPQEKLPSIRASIAQWESQQPGRA
ncbi:MAG: hypothetical protein LCH62_01180 [Proteobacteria bacterium]|nr:hypothetical protein [Pseudomonadota bacterium]